MDLVMNLGSGWVIGLILGMVTGLLVSLVLLKDSETPWLWESQKQKDSELVQVKAKLFVMQKDLDSVQLSEQDLRLQLRRLMEKEKQKELAQEKALKWDLA
jgi:hypothetical protein